MDTQTKTSAPKTVKKIFSVKIVRLPDDDPDTSWLGEYANQPTSDYSIDRAHSVDCPAQTYVCNMLEPETVEECDCGGHGDMERNQYRYFNPSFRYDGTPKDLTPEQIREHTLRNYERMESLYRGAWECIGIRAEAEVGVSLNGGKDYVTETISSGGLWGIESDSAAGHLWEVGAKELAELKDLLIAYGFGRAVFGKAIKNAETE